MRPTALVVAARIAREGDMIVDGMTVLAIGVGVLALMWSIVIYGSHYFGPK
jgi:hypothetical protein